MNKNVKYLLIVAGLGVFISLGLFMATRTNALNVNDVAGDPSAFTGTITVTGVVAGVSQADPTIIGMMDKKELQCTTPGCKKVYLPFKAPSYTAVQGDEVRVTGKFVPTQFGSVLMADRVSVVQRHKIGG
jgi:hypothetical protein